MDLSNKNVIHVKKDNIEYLQFKKLLEYSDKVSHAYSLGTNFDFRTSKPNKENLSEEKYKKVIENYKNLCNAIDVDYRRLVKTNQEHTDEIKIIDKKINQNEPDFNLSCYDRTDGYITSNKNIILSTTNADCILLIFYDPVKNVIANIHSGWRGTIQRISIKCVNKMIKEKGCNAKDILCFICPSIRKCHFEVDEDVSKLFYNEFSDFNNINEIITKQKCKEKWNIDTVLINRMLLNENGLKDENIIDCEICSVCNKNLIHSFRVEGKSYGLETAIIGLK